MAVAVRQRTEHGLIYLLLIVFGFIFTFPFLYMFLSSLKTSQDIVNDPTNLFPNIIQLGNYTEAISVPNINLGQQLFNTIIVTTTVVVGQVFTSLLAGYAFARLRFPGRDLLFYAYLGTLMVPFAVLIVPMYKLMQTFGWIDSLLALTIPWLYTAYGTFLLRQFFMGLPRDLEEAALIDGASRWGILFRIATPLAKPAIATIATFSFLYAWNSFLWPLIVINSPNKKVITQGIIDLQSLYAVRIDLILAGSVLAVLPTMIVYVFAQRYFIEGVATSGLAGR